MVGVSLGRWNPQEGGMTRRIHIRNHQHEHKRNLELRIETKRTTSILGAEVYEEWLFGPFRPVVRTSSFHVEDTGSIPVRDRYSFSKLSQSLAASRRRGRH